MSIDEEENMDEDGISSIGSTENGRNGSAFSIARQLAVKSSRLATICYSLIGVHEDNTQEEWDGFIGNPPRAYGLEDWNGFDEDEVPNDDEYLEANSEEPTGAILNEY